MTAIGAVIATLPFRFAKTMPDNPHEYTVRSAATEEAYVQLFQAIQEHGTPELYQGRRYRYLRPGDGWKYWAMTSAVGQSRIINRAKVTDEAPAGSPSS
jgi:hypothetical protein